jgi:hypothetical protein
VRYRASSRKRRRCWFSPQQPPPGLLSYGFPELLVPGSSSSGVALRVGSLIRAAAVRAHAFSRNSIAECDFCPTELGLVRSRSSRKCAAFGVRLSHTRCESAPPAGFPILRPGARILLCSHSSAGPISCSRRFISAATSIVSRTSRRHLIAFVCALCGRSSPLWSTRPLSPALGSLSRLCF